jgi:hypothetical protein
MSQEIRLDPSLIGSPLTGNSATKKADEASAAALQTLEEILNAVVMDEEKGKSKGKTSASEATAVNMESVINDVRASLLSNPNDFEAALKLIAPYTQDTGKKVTAQLSKVNEAFLQYQKAVSSVSEETIASDYKTFLQPAMENCVKSVDAVNGLYDEISPLLEKLNGRDPVKFQAFVTRLAPILGLIALRNPAKAKEILGSFSTTLESVII